MLNKFSICITTFKERYKLCTELISSISKFNNTIDINVAVNGNNEEQMDPTYRKNILSFCSAIPNCYPIVCPQFKSLSKLWNTLVIFSNTEYNLILNDDVSIVNSDVLYTIERAINETSHEFFTLNGSFSHFVITKNILHNLNYFDERLIAFGEEDGDMVHRYILFYKNQIPTLPTKNIININAHDQSSGNLETHIDNKPRFNREYVNYKYVSDPGGICGMNPFPLKKVVEDSMQYPYERFVTNNKHNIKKFNNIIHEYR